MDLSQGIALFLNHQEKRLPGEWEEEVILF